MVEFSTLTLALSFSTKIQAPDPELPVKVQPLTKSSALLNRIIAAPLPAVLFPSNTQLSNVTFFAPLLIRTAAEFEAPSVPMNFTFLTVTSEFVCGQSTPAILLSSVLRPLNTVILSPSTVPSRVRFTTECSL